MSIYFVALRMSYKPLNNHHLEDERIPLEKKGKAVQESHSVLSRSSTGDLRVYRLRLAAHEDEEIYFYNG